MKHSAQPDLMLSIFSEAEIARRVSEIAAAINQSFPQEPLAAICVLKGAFIFFSDLVRQIANPNLELDFVQLSSYGASTNSSGQVRLKRDAEIDIRDKHVLIVEDIVDSGKSMRFLCEQFRQRHPASISIAALVDKMERRESDVKVDFPGFRVEKGFLVGYGMDYAEKYRALPDICELRWTQ